MTPTGKMYLKHFHLAVIATATKVERIPAYKHVQYCTGKEAAVSKTITIWTFSIDLSFI
jgi:hypothetical protein